MLTGAHLWNIQESSFDYNSHAASKKEICHDVLYREGQNLQRQITFTPRLIAFDLKVCRPQIVKWFSVYL